MLYSPKRLAIFIPSLDDGGAQRLILNLSHGFTERGYNTDLVLAQATGAYYSEIPKLVRVVDLKASRVISSLPALVRYLRRERPQAMLCALNYANIIALWAKRLAGVSTSIIVSEHNTLSIAVRNAHLWRQRLMPNLISRFYPWADDIVTVSQGVAKDLSELTGLPKERIKTIYNPVVTPNLAQKAQASLDHPWFKAGEPPVVLAVGRLNPQKDFPTLIKAFAQVCQNHAARLLILGEGSERPALESLIEKLGLTNQVSLPGFVINPYSYMARAHVFVLSSRWEGLGNVLIEAMYCGTPIISTDCPHGPREILQDGKYGQLVPVGDVAALAQAIKRSLHSRHNQPPLPQESWQPFELNTVMDQYLNLLVGN